MLSSGELNNREDEKMIYEGKISFKRKKILLAIIALLFLITFRNLIIIYTFMILYSDILLCEKLSNAKINNNKVSITKHDLYGLVKRNTEFILVNPEQTLQNELTNLPEGVKTFNIQSLDKIANCNIKFYYYKKETE